MHRFPAVFLTVAALGAAEIELDDGRRIAGELVPAGPDEIRIRIPLGAGPAEMVFPAARVVRIDAQGGSDAGARLALQREIEAMPAEADAEAWMAAAARARAAGLGALARRCAEAALRADRWREDAARIAGLVRHRGVWMRPAEVAACRGQVWHGGRWMAVPERDRAVEDERRLARIQAEAQAEAARRLAERAAAPAPVSGPTVLVLERTVVVPRVCVWDRPVAWCPPPVRTVPVPVRGPVITAGGRFGAGDGSVAWSFRW
ncbi:MAG: hypothetical protein RLZZ127_827 [Planctomycetota bacterium]|jgi:hypothetical protein